nr:hypothetical protein [Mycoplasmopsis bovis]
MRYDKNAESKLELSNYLIKQSNSKILLDDKTVLEIGMGKGEMIVELAKAHPDLKFIGLEKYATVALLNVFLRPMNTNFLISKY